MMLTNYALEIIGKEMTQVTEVGAPDVSDIHHKWLPMFSLNSIFRMRLEPPAHQIVLAFLRRTEAAFAAYKDGREALTEYVNTDNSVVSPYFRALTAFEICVAQGYQAFEILMVLTEKEFFQKRDQSDPERLNQIYNRSKHINKEIRRKEFPLDHSGPVWLSNRGLEAQDICFPFPLFRELLEGLAEYAKILTTVKPQQSNKNIEDTLQS